MADAIPGKLSAGAGYLSGHKAGNLNPHEANVGAVASSQHLKST